jgi:hypothetical protein
MVPDTTEAGQVTKGKEEVEIDNSLPSWYTNQSIIFPVTGAASYLCSCSDN